MNNDKYLTVSALSKYLKFLFEENEHLKHVYLKGEISNFKAHTSGHFYFSIKDETSKINAVMFSYNNRNLKFTPTDGMKVLVCGKVSVYEASGGYQIYVEEMLEDGLGNLYIAYEELKKKLEQEGLFDESHKKKIPSLPKTVGIVTAKTGAAIKDILTTIKRRYPICGTILFPSLVQGSDAAVDIANKIKLAENFDIDVLIVGRGGGSIEDLWPFNEEVVARAIYESKIPIISAVGHEIDFTISDFVADLRAPTPTAAAEMAVPDIRTLELDILNYQKRITSVITSKIKREISILKKIKESYVLTKPMAVYEIKMQKLDNLIETINKSIKIILERKITNLFKLKNNYLLNHPDTLYKYKEQNLLSLISKLEVLNPLNTIKRGYAIVRCDKKVISSVKSLKTDEMIEINLKDGIIKSKVIEVEVKSG